MVVVFGCEAPPVIMISAIIKRIGNSYKLTKIIVRKIMDTLETKFNSIYQTDFVMETLLVVSNFGGQKPTIDSELSRCLHQKLSHVNNKEG